MKKREELQPHEEDLLVALFQRTATPTSDAALRRLEATARGIPGDARPGPWQAWITAAVTLGAAAMIAVLSWPAGDPGVARTGAAPTAAFADVRGDLSAVGADEVATLSFEQNEGWELSLDPFGVSGESLDEGGISLAHGIGEAGEIDLWVQAADEILQETGGI